MNWMFYGAISFNQPLNNWDVSNVTNMWSMFKNASSFNQPLNNWNVSNEKSQNRNDCLDFFLSRPMARPRRDVGGGAPGPRGRRGRVEMHGLGSVRPPTDLILYTSTACAPLGRGPNYPKFRLEILLEILLGQDLLRAEALVHEEPPRHGHVVPDEVVVDRRVPQLVRLVDERVLDVDVPLI